MRKTIIKKTTNIQALFNGGSFKGAKFGGNVFSENQLTQFIATKEEKNCPICQEPVGINHLSNCQCEKDHNHCEYCQTDQKNKQNCSCIREENQSLQNLACDNEQQTNNRQTLIAGGEFDKAEFTGNAFTKNVLEQIIGQKESKKICLACELAIPFCHCQKKNNHCEYCQGDSIDKGMCYCYRPTNNYYTASEGGFMNLGQLTIEGKEHVINLGNDQLREENINEANLEELSTEDEHHPETAENHSETPLDKVKTKLTKLKSTYLQAQRKSEKTEIEKKLTIFLNSSKSKEGKEAQAHLARKRESHQLTKFSQLQKEINELEIKQPSNEPQLIAQIQTITNY